MALSFPSMFTTRPNHFLDSSIWMAICLLKTSSVLSSIKFSINQSISSAVRPRGYINT